MKAELREALEQLNPRQRQFVLGFALHHEPQRAAVEAGYKKGAKVTAQKLLKKPQVQRVLAVLERDAVNKVRISKRKLLEQMIHAVLKRGDDFLHDDLTLKNISEWNERAHAVFDGIELDVTERLDEDGNVVSRKIKPKLKTVSKAQAIDMLAKVMGVYAPEKRQQLNVNTSIDPQALFDKVHDLLEHGPPPNPVTELLEEREPKDD